MMVLSNRQHSSLLRLAILSLATSSCNCFTYNNLPCSGQGSDTLNTCRNFKSIVSPSFSSTSKRSSFHSKKVQRRNQRDLSTLLFSSTLGSPEVIEKKTKQNDKAGPSSPSFSSSEAPQILTFKEPSTNVTVMLIGAMHYNPSSIQLTQDTLLDLKSKGNLGAVVIETCDVRWTSSSADKNITAEEILQKQKMSKFLKNEMRTAYDVAHGLLDDDEMTSESPSSMSALSSSVPVILGDQRINITATRMKEVAQETLWDLATPLGGGWGRLFEDIKLNMELALPQNSRDANGGYNDNTPKYIDARGFLDPRLLLAMPVTLLKYPLSWFVRAPFGSAVAATLFLTLNFIADHTSSPFDLFAASPAMAASTTGAAAAAASSVVSDAAVVPSMLDWVGSLLFALAEVAVLGRILIKALLAERNVVLADNILHQCQLVASRSSSRGQQQQQSSDNNPFVSLWNKINDGVQGITDSLTSPKQQQKSFDSEDMIYYAMPPSAKSATLTLSPSPPTLSALSSMPWPSSSSSISRSQSSSLTDIKNFDIRKLQSIVKAVPRDQDDGNSGKLSTTGDDPTVVAVLGMAHCNGIMKLMLENNEFDKE